LIDIVNAKLILISKEEELALKKALLNVKENTSKKIHDKKPINFVKNILANNDKASRHPRKTNRASQNHFDLENDKIIMVNGKATLASIHAEILKRKTCSSYSKLNEPKVEANTDNLGLHTSNGMAS